MLDEARHLLPGVSADLHQKSNDDAFGGFAQRGIAEFDQDALYAPIIGFFAVGNHKGDGLAAA